ncbi:Reverse transcriptase, related [Eimeria mitis]|uniref:Reverse transcriptase, related n=1 Tax=Eimeria mitis TaxID=44415 RepID=U6KJD9_9EIME|nr:Reverse transcriptase, related [Eimeria mitis]CDJ36357.1 Reverse transcriptase, related [Eimeria mitis]
MLMRTNSAILAEPLVWPTHPNVQSVWRPQHRQVVKALKKRLIDFTTLQVLDRVKPYQLLTEAFGYAIGSKMMQTRSFPLLSFVTSWDMNHSSTSGAGRNELRDVKNVVALIGRYVGPTNPSDYREISVEPPLEFEKGVLRLKVLLSHTLPPTSKTRSRVSVGLLCPDAYFVPRFEKEIPPAYASVASRVCCPTSCIVTESLARASLAALTPGPAAGIAGTTVETEHLCKAMLEQHQVVQRGA